MITVTTQMIRDALGFRGQLSMKQLHGIFSCKRTILLNLLNRAVDSKIIKYVDGVYSTDWQG